MKLLEIAVLGFLLTGFVCKSGDAVKETSGKPGSGTDTTVIPSGQQPQNTAAPVVQSTSAPTALKSNATRITGTVRKIEFVDSLNFRAIIHIDSAFTIGDMPSLIDAGQEITASPRFLRNSDGFIEVDNERNKRHLLLRNKSVGSPFSGKISMQSPGQWVIIDTDSL